MAFEEAIGFPLTLIFALLILFAILVFLLYMHSHSETGGWISSFLNVLKKLLTPPV